jgi:hypothetical protein
VLAALELLGTKSACVEKNWRTIVSPKSPFGVSHSCALRSRRLAE